MMISGISPLGGLLQGGASTATRGAGAAADLGASFGAALANAAERTVETLQGAEKLSITAMQGGEVRRAFELNTAIVKSFHRMMMMNTRS